MARSQRNLLRDKARYDLRRTDNCFVRCAEQSHDSAECADENAIYVFCTNKRRHHTLDAGSHAAEHYPERLKVASQASIRCGQGGRRAARSCCRLHGRKQALAKLAVRPHGLPGCGHDCSRRHNERPERSSRSNRRLPCLLDRLCQFLNASRVGCYGYLSAGRGALLFKESIDLAAASTDEMSTDRDTVAADRPLNCFWSSPTASPIRPRDEIAASTPEFSGPTSTPNLTVRLPIVAMRQPPAF